MLIWCVNAPGAPPNDSFESRSILAGSTNFVLATNIGASKEPQEPDHGKMTGGSSVWWSWTAPVTGTCSVSTEGSSFDTGLGIYTGSAFTNLQTVAGDDDSGSNYTSVAIFRAIAGETYQIAVDGFLGATGEIVLRLGPAGYLAPEWTLLTATGTVVSSSAFRNKVLLVDFFETICTACWDETPVLIYLESLYGSGGFEVIGISKDISIPTLIYNTRILGINYTVVVNRAEVEAAFGGPVMPPTKFLVDREGKIQTKLVGANELTYYNDLIRPLIRGASKLPLQIHRSSNAVALSWPATEFGWRVESATAPGSYWMSVSNSVSSGTAENVVTLPILQEIMFFRLRKP
jgi:thiol-disulfide isomerase/thioredoxin